MATRSAKKKLAFVGDGINDAPVLSRADIGIAMGALGSDAAIEAADIVLMDDDPSKIALARKISVHTLKIVKENILFFHKLNIACKNSFTVNESRNTVTGDFLNIGNLVNVNFLTVILFKAYADWVT